MTYQRTNRDNMQNSSLTRCRKLLWFVAFAVFVLWYSLIYVHDWSSLDGVSPLIQNYADSVDPPDSSNEIDEATTNPTEPLVIEKATIQIIDQIASSSDNSTENQSKPDTKNRELETLCSSRYVYIHEIPKRFNDDLVENCRSLSDWTNMCRYMDNNGLGERLPRDKVFSGTGWFATNQFSLEIIFHNRMKQYKCLTRNSSMASAIFVPYYAGLDVNRYLWGSGISLRDSGALDLYKWLREQPEWEFMSGRDHFLVAGRITWDFRRGVDEDSAWGNKLMLLPESKNITMLTIESSPWNGNDFAIPYPTYFHPSSDGEVLQWQNRMRRLRRRFLFSFAGAPRPDMEDSIRSEIMAQCQASRRRCKLLECRSAGNKCMKPAYLMRLFLSSVFCLQPSGDSFTRRSTFDSIVAGCIPVFFHPASAYTQYMWHLPRNFRKYSVLIPENEVKAGKVSIERELRKMPAAKVAAMREEVIKLIPKVVYADPSFSSRLERVEDAFDLTVKGVLERVEKLRGEAMGGGEWWWSEAEELSWKKSFFGRLDNSEWDHFFERKAKDRY
ncbi:LOW QUALITY PROTEIN: probable xyloglucan galactosyltransferase GT11 [Diospyros lotus]|uniref:LOW QUALITY PROTEIN: probable xyloglucan galactosyltransferase GT11 n=1 Tax=Diospyros lotus TaxID=55363 RepID=UPI00225BFF7F|nr:LOW QUALITY PROTEIN: probable xyloglucan galactosyltransferase GT11 [Diospyros lotus]